MKFTTTAIAGVAASGALALAAVPVLAQDATDAASTTESGSTDDTGTAEAEDADVGRHGPGAGPGAALAQELAAELGLDPDDVETALEGIRERWMEEHAADREERRAEMAAARQDALDQAVADGTVTQDQADLVEQLWEARADAAEGLRRDDLTDEQRDALQAFREAAGEEVLGDRGGRGRGGHHGPRGMMPDASAGDGASDDATVREGSLDVTT